MIANRGATLGTLYRSANAGLTWKRVRPAGTLRGAVVDQFAFASDGRALALVRIGNRQKATFASEDAGLHWTSAPTLKLDTRSPAVYASPLAASGTTFLLGTNQRGFCAWSPGRAAGWPRRGPPAVSVATHSAGLRRYADVLGAPNVPPWSWPG